MALASDGSVQLPSKRCFLVLFLSPIVRLCCRHGKIARSPACQPNNNPLTWWYTNLLFTSFSQIWVLVKWSNDTVKGFCINWFLIPLPAGVSSPWQPSSNSRSPLLPPPPPQLYSAERTAVSVGGDSSHHALQKEAGSASQRCRDDHRLWGWRPRGASDWCAEGNGGLELLRLSG